MRKKIEDLNNTTYDEYLNSIYAHWGRRDDRDIYVYTSGYRTSEAYDIEKQLRKYGFFAISIDFDEQCGKTKIVYRSR